MPYDSSKHGPKRIVGPGFHEDVYQVVSTIPMGWIVTYGDVAAALGLRSVARHVGFALAALPDHRADVPWHRVVNARGDLRSRSAGPEVTRQQQLLEAESVEFTEKSRIVGMDSIRFVLDPINSH